MAFIDPMHRNKPNITYLLVIISLPPWPLKVDAMGGLNTLRRNYSSWVPETGQVPEMSEDDLVFAHLQGQLSAVFQSFSLNITRTDENKIHEYMQNHRIIIILTNLFGTKNEMFNRATNQVLDSRMRWNW